MDERSSQADGGGGPGRRMSYSASDDAHTSSGFAVPGRGRSGSPHTRSGVPASGQPFASRPADGEAVYSADPYRTGVNPRSGEPTPPTGEEPPGSVPSGTDGPSSGSRILTGVLVAMVLMAVAFGVVVGHEVWTRSITPITFPTVTIPQPTVPQGSSAAGGPANAGNIAAGTDPALVDIVVSDTYQAVAGAGTGIVLSAGGEVLTCNHVIEGATTIKVTDVGNGRTYSATVVGYDRSQDVAVLKLTNASGLKTVKGGNSSKVTTGDGVVAVGNAEGTGGTPTYAGGSVTATDQSITAQDEASGAAEQLAGLIETNADVVPGDSGGALVNRSGQVIGMIAAASEAFQFQPSTNQGYAIPINEADNVAGQIRSDKASRAVHIGPTAFLGVEVQSPFSGISGTEIVEVVPGGPAANAGLVPGDIITALNGRAITSPEELTDFLLGESPSGSVKVQYSDPFGVQSTVSVHLASGPAQ
jgi:S1-C subfamily serine protease